MASNINAQNIDGAYPVAGQDNDSQGFRDNFTNTKTNFQYAADEITDLQNKAVLKAALTGTTLDNNMGGSVLSNAQLRNISETVVTLGTQSGAQTLNYAAGPYYTLTTSGSVSLAFTNFPTSGTAATIKLQITVSNIAHTLTLPAAVGSGISATSVTTIPGYNAGVITFASTGTYVFEFTTSDSGTTIFVEDLTNAPFYTRSEDLAASAAVSLSTSASYFTTAAAETATLAAGADGQVKVLAAVNVSSGNMVITVTNPAWSGSGTITFSAAGQACTLQYLDSKWFCIGNNGATFG